MKFREFLNEGVSRKNPEDILKNASIYSKEESAKSALINFLKPENYTLIKDNETGKFLLITNKETSILTKWNETRFNKIKTW